MGAAVSHEAWLLRVRLAGQPALENARHEPDLAADANVRQLAALDEGIDGSHRYREQRCGLRYGEKRLCGECRHAAKTCTSSRIALVSRLRSQLISTRRGLVSKKRETPFPDVQVYGHGKLGPPRGLEGLSHEGAGAIIRAGGCEVVLHFASAEQDAPLLEIRIRPDQGDPAHARHLVPQLSLYLATARAAMSFKLEDFRRAVELLRLVGRPGRGLPPDHYRVIAAQYKALVREGEQHPVKALATENGADISTASRWVTEAKSRGLIEEEVAGDAS